MRFAPIGVVLFSVILTSSLVTGCRSTSTSDAKDEVFEGQEIGRAHV